MYNLTATSNTINSLKGALIILVVFGHMIEHFLDSTSLRYLYTFIYYFHMPVFIFLAGMTSKKEYSRTNIKKLIAGVLIPLLVFNVMYEVFYFTTDGHISRYLADFAPHWILWFLLSLFWWRLLAPLIVLIKFPILVSIIVSLVVSMIPNVGITLSLSRTAVYLPFFSAGLCYGNQILEYLKSVQESKYTKLFSVAVLVVPILSLPYINFEFLYGSKSFSMLNLTLQQGAALRLASYALAVITAIPFILFFSSIKKLEKYGQLSLQIFLWHGFVRMILGAQTFPTDIFGKDNFWGLAFYGVLATYLTTKGLASKFIRKQTRNLTQPLISRISSPATATIVQVNK